MDIRLKEMEELREKLRAEIARQAQLTFAKEVIDYLFLNHEHIYDLADESCLYDGEPYVLSLQMERWIKEKYPELKDYYYGKEESENEV